MAKKKAAELLVDVLETIGIERIYEFLATRSNGITDTIRQRNPLHS